MARADLDSQVYAGGSPSFEMVDDMRYAFNHAALETLATAAATSTEPHVASVDALLAMGGRIFNLGNTVPAPLEEKVRLAVGKIVEGAAASLAQQPNRSLAQGLLDVAGPRAAEGWVNCDGLANGWVYEHLLTPASQGLVRTVHALQWGRPDGQVYFDK